MSLMWLKRLVLAAALAVMPLQGVGAAVSILLCHGAAQAYVMHAVGSGDHAMHQDDRQDEGGAGVNPAYHLCCHYTVSAPAAVAPTAAAPDFPVRALAPDFPHDLHIPEQPQRPPLA